MATKAKVKEHYVAVPTANGGYELTRLKKWLRNHPADDPSGGKTKEWTSHALRDALKKNGWDVKVFIVCIKP